MVRQKMRKEAVNRVKKISQHYAYVSIRMHETIARKAGISGTDHKYLGFLLQNGPMTAGQLAALTGLTSGAVTGLIDRFEKKGLVKRGVAKNDRRKVIVAPETENIMALLQPLYADFRKRSEKLNASLSDAEIDVIESYLSKAIEIMIETTDSLNNKE